MISTNGKVHKFIQLQRKRMKFRTIIALAFSLLLITGSMFAKTSKECSILTNMHCNSCKNKIEKTLKGIKGIEESKADVDTKIVKVKYDADVTSEKAILKAVAGAGYKAELVTEAPKSSLKKEVRSSCQEKCGSKKSCSTECKDAKK